jgi:hypothetical protein
VGTDASITHFNGSGWQYTDLGDVPGTFWTVWGTASNNVIVMGDAYSFLWNGQKWSIMEGEMHHPIGAHPIAGDNIWVVSDVGGTAHWDGIAYEKVNAPTKTKLRGIWGHGTSEAWAVGDHGTILRWLASE